MSEGIHDPIKALAESLLTQLPGVPDGGYWGGDAMTENCIWLVMNRYGKPRDMFLFHEEAEAAKRSGESVYGIPCSGIAARVLAPFKVGLPNARENTIYPYLRWLQALGIEPLERGAQDG